jgi:peptide-methionine (S)-S-oxide reductase
MGTLLTCSHALRGPKIALPSSLDLWHTNRSNNGLVAEYVTEFNIGLMLNKKATFGAGCFWGIEAAFREVEGVIDVTVGYMGGWVKNPNYEMVCSGQTGHAEVAQVEFDPSSVSFERLLEVFWAIHDPTTLNRQGPDFGEQYRSVIFFHDEEQKMAAELAKKRLDGSRRYKRAVVTEISPATDFYPAEEYHQRYYERMGIAPHCGILRG